jgi:imidazolonepropionase
MGAHSIPREYKENRNEFIRILIEEMLPKVKEENLAKFVDVFCEDGAFTTEETRNILESAKNLGFGLKIHAEEFTNQGGAVLAGELGATSADHLLMVTDEDINNLAKTDTIMTLMPGTLFFLDYKEFAPARKIIDSGAKITLATDFNAGSCLSASMPMAMSLGCIKMKMTPEETINASTYNAAFAVGMEEQVGSIEVGKKADFVIFAIDDYRLIPYHFGENLVKWVIKEGRVVVER